MYEIRVATAGDLKEFYRRAHAEEWQVRHEYHHASSDTPPGTYLTPLPSHNTFIARPGRLGRLLRAGPRGILPGRAGRGGDWML